MPNQRISNEISSRQRAGIIKTPPKPGSKPELSLTGLGRQTEGFAISSLASIPAMRSRDPFLSGTTKLGFGLALSSETIASKFPKIASTGALGALGGGFAIAGIADLTSSFLPYYAALPASAFGGFAIGTEAFSSLGVSSKFAGIAGAALGLGFGVYSLISNRNERRRQQRAEAEYYAGNIEAAQDAISKFQKTLPLIEEERQELEKQYERNKSIISSNNSELNRVTNLNLKNLERGAAEGLQRLNIQLAHLNIGSEGLGWMLKTREEKELWENKNELAQQLSIEFEKLALSRETLESEFKSKKRELEYTTYTIEAQIGAARRFMQKNLNRLYGNSQAGQFIGAAQSALSLAAKLESGAGSLAARIKR